MRAGRRFRCRPKIVSARASSSVAVSDVVAIIDGVHLPEPADREFAERVRREITEADESARMLMVEQSPPTTPLPLAPDIVEALPEDFFAPPVKKPAPKPKPKAKKKRAKNLRNHKRLDSRRSAVLTWVLCGYTQIEIAEGLKLTEGIVQQDVIVLRLKYGARNTHHLAALAAFEMARNFAR